MMTTNRRKYSRQPYQVPILYAEYDTNTYNRAAMHNTCPYGMYFESESPLKPKFDLFIKIQGQRQGPRSDVPDQYKAFRARVRWCRRVKDKRQPFYGIDVQFTAKSHLSYGTNSTNAAGPCGYCEERFPNQWVHRTETGLLFCPDCSGPHGVHAPLYGRGDRALPAGKRGVAP